jgi:hypothetical protein
LGFDDAHHEVLCRGQKVRSEQVRMVSWRVQCISIFTHKNDDERRSPLEPGCIIEYPEPILALFKFRLPFKPAITCRSHQNN